MTDGDFIGQVLDEVWRLRSADQVALTTERCREAMRRFRLTEQQAMSYTLCGLPIVIDDSIPADPGFEIRQGKLTA